MRDVAHYADDLAPRLVLAFEAQPSSKRGVYVAAEMNADKFIVHQNYRRRIVRVSLAQHAPSEKRNAKRACRDLRRRSTMSDTGHCSWVAGSG